MDLYTIYFDAPAFPGMFSACRFEVNKGRLPSPEYWVGSTLEAARVWVWECSARRGTFADVLFIRDPQDEYCVVESWI